MPQEASLQDVDLLARLNQYLDGIGSYVKEGRGWLIFNAGGARSARINRFLLDALSRQSPPVEHHFVPWRDFSLHAYMLQVELTSLVPTPDVDEGGPWLRSEYELANRVTLDQLKRMFELPLVIISGVAPSRPYEVRHLDSIIEARHRTSLATVLITPRSLEQLSSDFRAFQDQNDYWSRFFERMYQSSLIAL